MSTFLQLVQDLHREAGCAGNAPATVSGTLTGEAKRLVNWIKGSNLEIQNKWENWKFLRCTYSQTTTATVNTLAAPTAPNALGAGMWDYDTFFVTQSGDTVKMPLVCQEYSEVKTEIVDITPGVPWRVVVMPDNSLRFEGTPDGAHTIEADFFREPLTTELTSDGDTSSIPSRFHRVILGHALMAYAEYEGAQEIMSKGQRIYGEQMALLENSQLDNKKKARFRTGGHFQVYNE